MPRIASKSIILNFIKSYKETLWRTIIGHFLYTHIATTNSPTRVEINKGLERLLRLISKVTGISEITKDSVNPESSNT